MAHLDEQRKIQPEYRLSYRIQRADGSSCWVMESSRLTVNADGVPEYVCIIIDDTEQKIIENRRIAVERQYRRALQSVCEMLIQVDLTNDLVLSEYVRWGASSRFPGARTTASAVWNSCRNVSIPTTGGHSARRSAARTCISRIWMRTRPSHTLNTALKNLRATITGSRARLVPLED